MMSKIRIAESPIAASFSSIRGLTAGECFEHPEQPGRVFMVVSPYPTMNSDRDTIKVLELSSGEFWTFFLGEKIILICNVRLNYER
jgi:hypothetical protein